VTDAKRVARVVALGASNLTLGLESLARAAQAAWGRGPASEPLEILAALGYGRSYGLDSSIAWRRLPGILHSGLWRSLDAEARVPTRGLITDVGNDILYGASSDQILEWVAEAAVRLALHADEITVTGLPVPSIANLSDPAFVFFRSVFYPHSKVARSQVVESAIRLEAGLAKLGVERGLRFVPCRPAWYSVDPIHIRPSRWTAAWSEILLGDIAPPGAPPFSPMQWARLHTLAPERRWLFGIERHAAQHGLRLRGGVRLKLY
jgi:hypothetical protein